MYIKLFHLTYLTRENGLRNNQRQQTGINEKKNHLNYEKLLKKNLNEINTCCVFRKLVIFLPIILIKVKN